MPRRIPLLIVACVFSIAHLTDGRLQGADKPNILILMADDCTFRDLRLYGGRNAETPNIDRLATEGLTFNRAYLTSSMCQPCRAELYSGQYPMRNGCAWNHSASRSQTRSMPHWLGRLGYRVGLAGKVHVKPKAAFPFELLGGYDKNCVRNPTQTHDVGAVRSFLRRDASQPFCLVVALVEPHVPWVMGDSSRYPPDKLELPPNLADTPGTREAFSRYLAEITYMDGQIGELLRLLDELNLTEETLVLFTSEQGAQFPGSKWTNWDTGVHTALVARWPGKIAAGTRTDALVQYADVLPTLLQAAGADSDATLDGTGFLDVLLGKRKSHRKYVYGMHNNVPEGPPYPLRSVTAARYRLILNLLPDEMYIERHLMGLRGEGLLNNPYWGTWIWNAADDPRAYTLVKRYTHRPPLELYDIAKDPYELQNLANEPSLREVQAELLAALKGWMADQGDPGIPQDTQQALHAARQGRHLYFPPLPR